MYSEGIAKDSITPCEISGTIIF